MEFGKLDSIESVDFQLPPDAESNTAVFEKLKNSGAPKTLYVGCTGWGMKEWVGKYYPAGAKTSDFLQHYGQQFNTIEHNTTHYRIPDAATVEKWRSETPDDFRFCPKLPQIISHSYDLGLTNGKLIDFCEAIHGLEEKLGCCFLQLPPYFEPERLPVLEKFFSQFPNHLPLALEVRAEQWFADQMAFNRLFELMEKHRIAPVITDVAGRRDVLHMRLTTDTVLIRFVGNNLHPTDFSRIHAWIERLHAWFNADLTNVYFFCHEPDNLLAPELATYLVKQFQKTTTAVQTRGPKLLPPKSEQMRLF